MTLKAGRVAVTGASGFVGRAVVSSLLGKSLDVVLLGRSAVNRKDVEFVRCDLLDPTSQRRALAASRCDTLIHGAWVTDPGVCWTSPLNLDWSAATMQLARSFYEMGGRRAVFIGSCAEYDWSHSKYREYETPCRPHTLYGVAKNSAFRLISAYAEENKLSYAWARLFFLYGPGEREGRLVSDAITTLARREKFRTTEGTQRRDFFYVEDAGDALASLLLSNVSGPVNVGSGDAVSVRSILEEVAEQMDRRSLVDFGALPTRKNEPPIVEADITRLSEEVGFRARFNMKEGIEIAIRAALETR